MHEGLDVVIDIFAGIVAIAGLFLVLRGARRRFPLSPLGYSIIVISFGALLAGVVIEGTEHFLNDNDSAEAAEVLGHLLVVVAIAGFTVGFLRWMPSTERLSAEIQRRQAREDELHHLALRDQLTGIANRTLFHEQLSKAIQRAKRRETSLAVLAIDLDGFKEINDRFGHDTGDLLLRDVAQRLRRGVRSDDLVARLSGDEFLVLMVEGARAEQSAAIAQRLLRELDQAEGLSSIAITGSIGIALYPQDSDTAEVLLKHADFALYEAKVAGKSCYRFFDKGFEHKIRTQKRRLEALQKAVSRDELVVVYQPQVNSATGAVVGVEALVRWNHPDEGLLSPAIFIPLAEEARMMAQIDAYVLHQACLEGARWQAWGTPIRLSVNVSAQSITSALTEMVAQALRESGLAPAALELEITETCLLSAGASTAAEVLEDLAALGVNITIDDFGTGYGSLVYLNSLPINAIKIDRQFVQAAPIKKEAATIVTALVEVARTLELRVVGEGIETAEQLEFLRHKGCEIVQGYWFSHPLSPPELEQFMRVRDSPTSIL